MIVMPSILPPIKVKRMRPTAQLPCYMSAGAAGADVFVDFGGITRTTALVQSGHVGDVLSSKIHISSCDWFAAGHLSSVSLHDHQTVVLPLGIAMEIPEGWMGQLKSRSGAGKAGHEGHLAYIDSDYRGEVGMIFHVGAQRVTIRHGERIGQIAFIPAPQREIIEVDELSTTERGAGGFGSTGR